MLSEQLKVVLRVKSEAPLLLVENKNKRGITATGEAAGRRLRTLIY
jgi:hypothetical protein